MILGTHDTDKSGPYIIAELDNGFGNDVATAKKMVRIAAAAEANAVKFQMRKLPWMLTIEEHAELMSYCHTVGIDYLCTTFDSERSSILNEWNVPFFKVGSGEFGNLPFLTHLCSFNKPIMVSTGMTDWLEINEVLTLFTNLKAKDRLILTQCTSIYPCPYERVNLRVLNMYKTFGVEIGFSDHTPTIYTALAAVGLGACIIEKHFTLSRSRTDSKTHHPSAIEPNELFQLVEGCRAVWQARGTEKHVFPEEQNTVELFKHNMRKSNA